MWLFLAFLIVPLIEIALFIEVGGAIGLWPTLAIVVLTAVIGASLMRSQGAMALGRIRSSFERLDDPTEPLAHGAMILIAGALLLTPGFFTDAVGFALLMPPVRKAIIAHMRRRVVVQHFEINEQGVEKRYSHGPEVIDASYRDVTDEQPSRRGSSGWTRH